MRALGSATSDVEFFIVNTVNASLGPDSPTSFDPGTYTQQEMNVNFDVTYLLSELVNLAGGVEYRDEEFEIGVGQVESWLIGPLADQGFSAASNGFPGFADIAGGTRPQQLRRLRRRRAAARTTVLGGRSRVRFEDFEDFGSTTNGKVVGPLQVQPIVRSAWRGPDLLPGADARPVERVQRDHRVRPGEEELVNNGTIPPTSEVALLRGGEPLQPEESENYSVGLVFDRRSFSFTIDAFRVDMTRSTGAVGGVRPHPGGGRRAGGGGHHRRRQHRELPFLRQRLRDQDRGHRRRRELGTGPLERTHDFNCSSTAPDATSRS